MLATQIERYLVLNDDLEGGVYYHGMKALSEFVVHIPLN